MTGSDSEISRGRKVTAHVPADLHARLVIVKLTTGKTLGDLMREGLERIAEDYRPNRKP